MINSHPPKSGVSWTDAHYLNNKRSGKEKQRKCVGINHLRKAKIMFQKNMGFYFVRSHQMANPKIKSAFLFVLIRTSYLNYLKDFLNIVISTLVRHQKYLLYNLLFGLVSFLIFFFFFLVYRSRAWFLIDNCLGFGHVHNIFTHFEGGESVSTLLF